jgi:sec-independent protein translocase protein TatB
MFGLSTWELLIIIAVALIFVGPDQLPKVARTIGKGMQQVRGAMGKVDSEMRKAVREVSAQLDDDGNPLAEAWSQRPTGDKPEAAPPDAPPAETAPAAPPAAPPVEVQTSRRGAGRTMNERPADPAVEPPAQRDWSEVGKNPIPGTVAQAPQATAPSPADAPMTADATATSTAPPEKPAA